MSTTDAEASPQATAAIEKPRSSKARPPLFFLEAQQNTWLKKQPIQASELPEDQRVAVPRGKRLGVVRVTELPHDAHQKVELAADAGTWFIFSPHFQREQDEAPIQSVIDWHDFNCQINPYLTVGEVLQFDSRRRPSPGGADSVRILQTAGAFYRIRIAWGTPIGVTSFYRPEPINQQVGGVPGSRHVTGEAMDIYPIGGRSLDEFYRWIRPRWTGGLGDGRNRGFIHLDTRNGGHFAPGAGRAPCAEWLY